MPGGMVAAVVDPLSANGGVVFASIARVPDQSKGMLRALDPLTLREIWNNDSEDYAFAKFVPATIAGKQVLLPTASGEVRVYGLR
jgi:outer membrane protein assembly factor BamB